MKLFKYLIEFGLPSLLIYIAFFILHEDPTPISYFGSSVFICIALSMYADVISTLL